MHNNESLSLFKGQKRGRMKWGPSLQFGRRSFLSLPPLLRILNKVIRISVTRFYELQFIVQYDIVTGVFTYLIATTPDAAYWVVCLLGPYERSIFGRRLCQVDRHRFDPSRELWFFFFFLRWKRRRKRKRRGIVEKSLSTSVIWKGDVEQPRALN